jgi:hypothetical protein
VGGLPWLNPAEVRGVKPEVQNFFIFLYFYIYILFIYLLFYYYLFFPAFCDGRRRLRGVACEKKEKEKKLIFLNIFLSRPRGAP